MITDDQKWVPIGQAAVMLGVSERTVRNYINSGKVPVHKDRGRTYVDIGPLLADRPGEFQNAAGTTGNDFETVGEGNPGTLLKIIGAELALRGQAQEMMTRVERETEALRGDLVSARRSGRRGWAMVILFLICAGGGGAWSARELQRRDGLVNTAEVRATAHAEAAQSAQEQRAFAMKVTQEQYATAQAQYTRTLEEYDGEVGQLREQLTTARATLDERISGEVERANSDADRREEAARVELSALAQIEILDRKLEDAKAELEARGKIMERLEQSLETERMKVALQSEKRIKDAEATARAEAEIESLERMLTDYKERVVRLEEMFQVGWKGADEEASKAEAASEAAVKPSDEPLNAPPAVGKRTLDKQGENETVSKDATAKLTPE